MAKFVNTMTRGSAGTVLERTEHPEPTARVQLQVEDHRVDVAGLEPGERLRLGRRSAHEFDVGRSSTSSLMRCTSSGGIFDQQHAQWPVDQPALAAGRTRRASGSAPGGTTWTRLARTQEDEPQRMSS